jgi:hypothetical protein
MDNISMLAFILVMTNKHISIRHLTLDSHGVLHSNTISLGIQLLLTEMEDTCTLRLMVVAFIHLQTMGPLGNHY